MNAMRSIVYLVSNKTYIIIINVYHNKKRKIIFYYSMIV